MLRWTPIVMVACTGGAGDSDPVLTGDQLRALGLNVGGFNVLHGSGPDLDDGTDLGQVPLHGDAYLLGGRVPVRVVGAVTDWTVELLGGEGVFGLESDTLGGLAALRCVPPAQQRYTTDLVVTAASQPGREFRVRFACTGDDRVGVLPFQVDAVGADSTLAGFDPIGGQVMAWAAGQLRALGLGGVPRTGVTDSGEVFLTDGGALRVVAPGSTQAEALPLAQPLGGEPRIRADGSQVLYVGANQLRVFDRASGADQPLTEPHAYTALIWSSADGRQAVVHASDTPSVQLTLWWVDVQAGTVQPFVDPDGAPWVQGPGEQLVGISDDQSTMIRLRSYYYDVALERVNLGTGEVVDLLGPAAEHAASLFGARHAIRDIDLSRDHGFAAVVFDNIEADPGGFRIDGSAVYGIDLRLGTTWLASVDLAGEPMVFAQNGGWSGRTLEHVRLRADGGLMVFGDVYRSERSAWVELP